MKCAICKKEVGLTCGCEDVGSKFDWIENIFLTVEHGHICVRNKFGWHLWGEKIDTFPQEGFSLGEIINKSWHNEIKS